MSSTPNSQRSMPRRAAEWVGKHWEKSPWMFNAGGAVLAMLLGLATAFDPIPGWNLLTYFWVFMAVTAGVLLVLGPALLARRAERVQDLRIQIETLEKRRRLIDEACERDSADLWSVLDTVGRELLDECKVDTNDTRISFYQHHRDEKKFALVGRASRNPELVKRGRASYRDDIGIIARAWREEVAHDQTQYVNPDKWVAYQQRAFGIEESVARSISMKSRSYLGVRIDHKSVPVGILVIESTGKDRVTETHAETVRSHSAFESIKLMLRAAPKLPLAETLPG